jgi:hypothetical protein
MSAPRSPRTAEYRVLQALGVNCGVIVSDLARGECAFRFRADWDAFAPDEARILAALADEMPSRCHEMGGPAFLAWIDETLSNTFRVEPPQATLYIDLERTAQTLYRRHVSSTVRPFETHLPLIPIDLAAGGLGEDRARGDQEWIEARVPGRHALADDLFVVRIHGRSMEPDIPDGSLCVFRKYRGGSRGGGVYIVRRDGTLEDGGEFTIKRYDSVKSISAEGWQHEQIRMRPDNPDFPAWELSEADRYTTVAEFVTVLEDPPE